MASSVFDSPMLGGLFPVGEEAHLFSDRAVVRALLIVEGALAKAQGELGLIPKLSADNIHKASLEIQIDPYQLRQATAQNGVCIPTLVNLFRHALSDETDRDFVHYGATSQDIIDTALMLRLRQVLAKQKDGLKALLVNLAELAERHAHLLFIARTYGQDASPTSFGAIAAHWGIPILELYHDLEKLQKHAFCISLFGAVGTSAAFGPKANELRTNFANILGLSAPKNPWHTNRSPLLGLIDWQMRLVTGLEKIAKDSMLFTQSSRSVVSLGVSGCSSTMPQKANPVSPAALMALTRFVKAQRSCFTESHADARDAGSWFCEWISLPQVFSASSSALLLAKNMTQTLTPDAVNIQTELNANRGLIFAEALSFELAKTLGRQEAQEHIKSLCAEITSETETLPERAGAYFAALTGFDLQKTLGDAPQQAKQFAQDVKDQTA